jgi:hypothetical protein
MTPQEQIAAVIVTEMRAQLNSDDNKGDIGWVDTDLGTDRVTLDGTFNIDRIGEALLDAGKVNAERPPEWRCYFCDETFTDRRAAAAHFGVDEDCEPACRIKGAEGGLLKALRDTEEALFKATCALHDENAEALRTWQAVGSRHAAALIAAEQVGYDRGLRDSSVADGLTYAVQHNPNCPKPYLVRLPRGALDLRPPDETKDALGYGLTFLEAFAAARGAHGEDAA